MSVVRALVVAGAISFTGCLPATQAGAPDEPGVECPERPTEWCEPDEEICYQTDETIGCSYRVCLPVGMCQSARQHRRLATPDEW